MSENTKTPAKRRTPRERFEIGYLMCIGHPYSEVAERYSISRSHAYELKDYAETVLASMDDHAPDVPMVELTKQQEERMVLALALHCHSSLEGIWRFFGDIFGVNMSISRAAEIIKRAADKAAEWDKGVSLENIHTGANDEIFQCGKPIFSGIDVNSTYTYILKEMPDRKGETWKEALDEAKSHGLNLKVAISDQGTGLLSGVSKAFPEADIQYDVFHEMMEFRKELSRMEWSAFDHIRKECYWEKTSAENPRNKGYKECLENARERSSTYAAAFDEMAILLDWFQELMGFSGHSASESDHLARWLVDRMEEAARKAGEQALLKKTRKLRDKIPYLLGFVRRLQSAMDGRAAARNVPVEAYRLVYRLRTRPEPAGRPYLSERVDRLLGGRRRDVEEDLDELIGVTRRASSLVENLNSRIRTYINLKRMVPEKFFVLMKVYFNTKKYRRSAVDSRVGKSPIELMTGKEYPDFFELLGF